MNIRPATIHDVPRMQEIINSHAELGKMLFKSYAQLYEICATSPSPSAKANGSRETTIVGCVGADRLWADLAEIRSLAVDDAYRGRGIGRQLVRWTHRRSAPSADSPDHVTDV